MALSAANEFAGESSLYLVAILSGMTDMDAITISSARLVEMGPSGTGIQPSTGWKLIIVATMANHFFKLLLCLSAGSQKLALRVAVSFAIPMAAGALLLWIWPLMVD